MDNTNYHREFNRYSQELCVTIPPALLNWQKAIHDQDLETILSEYLTGRILYTPDQTLFPKESPSSLNTVIAATKVTRQYRAEGYYRDFFEEVVKDSITLEFLKIYEIYKDLSNVTYFGKTTHYSGVLQLSFMSKASDTLIFLEADFGLEESTGFGNSPDATPKVTNHRLSNFRHCEQAPLSQTKIMKKLGIT